MFDCRIVVQHFLWFNISQLAPFLFLSCHGHPRQLRSTRQFLLGVYNYLSDLPSYVCWIMKRALYEDQMTTLSLCVAAKIVPMNVLEVSISKPRHWNLSIGIGIDIETDITNAIISNSLRTPQTQQGDSIGWGDPTYKVKWHFNCVFMW